MARQPIPKVVSNLAPHHYGDQSGRSPRHALCLESELRLAQHRGQPVADFYGSNTALTSPPLGMRADPPPLGHDHAGTGRPRFP